MYTATKHDRSTAQSNSRFSPSPNRDPDAGLRAISHYERRLKWRNRLREWLLPIFRWETPYLARMQQACRSPVLDSYFAMTANLGTHTFFMMFLPVCFWCGYPDVGLALVHMLGLGVYLSGYVKDLVCLPRPLSPPLQRITMSGSAALEYGFPSTHTTNAVSAAMFFLDRLQQSRNDWSPTTYTLLCGGCYFYATSIALGRVYCGMHGLFDVIVGAILGAWIAWLRITFGPSFDVWIMSDGWQRPAIAFLVLALAVRFHPEPADNCPCFDDSVAFFGVIMGIEIGAWQYDQINGVSSAQPLPLAKMYTYTNQHLLKSVARVVVGIIIVFMWRAIMKPLLLRSLPPTFRFIDHWGLMIPRRYFLQAGDYTKVPRLLKDDNVIPSARDIPSMLSALGNPRKRRVSVGPQSEADVREYMANREQRRQIGRSSTSPMRKRERTLSNRKRGGDDIASSRISEEILRRPSDLDANTDIKSTTSLEVQAVDRTLLTPPPSDAGASSDSGREDETNDRKMFSAVEKPRTHYDVEVITKIVVYAGIAWLALMGNPMLFERVGLV